jgi:hypothetical protein
MSYNQYGQYTGDAYNYNRPQQPPPNNAYQYPSQYPQYVQASPNQVPPQSYGSNGQYAHPQQVPQNYLNPQAQSAPSQNYAPGYSQYYTQPQPQVHAQVPAQNVGNQLQYAAAQRMPSPAQYGNPAMASSPQIASGYYGAPAAASYNSWQPPANSGSAQYSPTMGRSSNSLDNNNILNGAYSNGADQYQNLAVEGGRLAPSPIQHANAISSPYLSQGVSNSSSRQGSDGFASRSSQFPQQTVSKVPRNVSNISNVSSPIIQSSNSILNPQSRSSSSPRISSAKRTKPASPHPYSRPTSALQTSHTPQVTHINPTQLYTPPPPRPNDVPVVRHMSSAPTPVAKPAEQLKKSAIAPVSEKQAVQVMVPPKSADAIKSPSIPKKSTPKTAQTPQSAQPDDIAYDMLLISISNEYIDTAYQLGPRVALLGEESDVETYNGLIAAGLTCLEAALKVRSLS